MQVLSEGFFLCVLNVVITVIILHVRLSGYLSKRKPHSWIVFADCSSIDPGIFPEAMHSLIQSMTIHNNAAAAAGVVLLPIRQSS